jgi:hypothetical protein
VSAPDARYSPAVRTLLERLPFAGRPPAGEGWRAGERREPLTGTHVRIHLHATAGQVDDVRWEARGCPHVLAACAAAAPRLLGRAPAGLTLDARALAGELGVPAEKLGRLFVIEDAVRNAALHLAADGS